MAIVGRVAGEIVGVGWPTRLGHVLLKHRPRHLAEAQRGRNAPVATAHLKDARPAVPLVEALIARDPAKVQHLIDLAKQTLESVAKGN